MVRKCNPFFEALLLMKTQHFRIEERCGVISCGGHRPRSPALRACQARGHRHPWGQRPHARPVGVGTLGGRDLMPGPWASAPLGAETSCSTTITNPRASTYALTPRPHPASPTCPSASPYLRSNSASICPFNHPPKHPPSNIHPSSTHPSTCSPSLNPTIIHPSSTHLFTIHSSVHPSIPSIHPGSHLPSIHPLLQHLLNHEHVLLTGSTHTHRSTRMQAHTCTSMTSKRAHAVHAPARVYHPSVISPVPVEEGEGHRQAEPRGAVWWAACVEPQVPPAGGEHTLILKTGGRGAQRHDLGVDSRRQTERLKAWEG
nr:uncharacterized protein LOC127489810 [Oryctolagus cuniculus]